MRCSNTQHDEGALLFVRLSNHAPLRWRVDACLPARYPDFDCRGCLDACPAGVLSIEDGVMGLADGCLGCGRCVAGCPTGALAMPGLALPEAGFEGGQPVEIECWKIPVDEIEAGAVRVPCLGALKASQMLDLRHEAGCRPIRIMDRGWCRGCEASGEEAHVAAPLVRTVNELLAAAGVPESDWVTLQAAPLSEKRRPHEIPDTSVVSRSLDRRAFLSGLGRQIAAAAQEVRTLDEGQAAIPVVLDRRSKVWPAERSARLAALSRLARRKGGALPPSLFPSIRVGPGCDNHGVCAALCPTGALQTYDAGTVNGLQFTAHLCIACGLCEAKCPEQALDFVPEGDGRVPDAVVNLTAFEVRECFDCGRSHAARDDDSSGADDAELPACPACRRSRGFARAAFGEFHGSPG